MKHLRNPNVAYFNWNFAINENYIMEWSYLDVRITNNAY